MDGRRTDTEKTEFIYHSTTQTGGNSKVGPSLSEDGSERTTTTITTEATRRHFLQTDEGVKELHRQSGKLPPEESYDYDGYNCPHCRYTRSAVAPNPIVKRTSIKQIWNYLKAIFKYLL